MSKVIQGESTYDTMSYSEIPDLWHIANNHQFVVSGQSRTSRHPGFDGMYTGDMFQSYETVIAFKPTQSWRGSCNTIYLDSDAWDYSRTTSKYRNQFLGMTTAQVKAGIKDGSIKLVNLNDS
jgi:hypothetical protein